LVTHRRSILSPSTVGFWFALAALASPAVVVAIGMAVTRCG
jgi:hypothetical protein